jgi:hypothetical protein
MNKNKDIKNTVKEEIWGIFVLMKLKCQADDARTDEPQS